VLEPSSHPAPPPPPPPPAAPAGPVPDGAALRLLDEVRAAQRQGLWTQGLLLALASGLPLLVAAGWLGATHPGWGRALAVAAPLVALGWVLGLGVFVPSWRVGTADRTARLLGQRAPELNLDILAAVELSRALGTRDDFSAPLARAFVADVDRRAARRPVASLLDQRPLRRVAAGALVTVVAVLVVLGWKGNTVRSGLLLAFTSGPAEGPARREPITGDFELTYHYPAHTGLEEHTVAGSTGDIAAPAGTEVALRTRADREVEGAALVVNGARVPLVVKGRELSGSFVLAEPGQYHVVFLRGSHVVAEGPDLALTVEADQPPVVHLSQPKESVELDPAKQELTLVYEASDDYGLSALELKYRPQGGEEQRVPLKPDEGRATRGRYRWELGALHLKPGQSLSYYLEATDNDAVKGPKKGVSATQVVKLYSAEEHRREALRKAEALWERLVTHLADRLEGPDRPSPATAEAALLARPADERASQLATDLGLLAGELDDERDPPEELLQTLRNVSRELQRDGAQVGGHRRVLLHLAGKDGSRPPEAPRPALIDAGRRLSQAVAVDAAHAQTSVLYLEALLDRQRLLAIKALARELKEDRRDLSRLLEDYARTKDPATQAALLAQMNELKQRMVELRERMAELARGVRDDFMNSEAMAEMLEDQSFSASLDDVERLVKEGRAEEALKKMQELSMKMDEFLDGLDEASEKADQQADPELARQFEQFQQSLDEAVKEQDQVAERTRKLRDTSRAQARERIARQAEALKRELGARLDELDKSWKELDAERYGPRFQEARKEAQRNLENVEQALKANDFDLASDSADRLEERAGQMADQAGEQRRMDEMFQNPPEVRRESRQLQDRLQRDAKKSQDVAQRLRSLFPQPGQQMSQKDRQELGELAQRQKGLQQKAGELEQQMEQLAQRAPIFNEEANQAMQQAGERMQNAQERLQSRDPSRGFGEQQGALQALRGLQQQMDQAGQRGGKGGIPLPLRGSRSGRGTRPEKVELPDEDPNQAPREFRKEVMDAMKQGAPDRYKDQNKKYYEELVK
jgi:Domain of unknown function (DUF4175)